MTDMQTEALSQPNHLAHCPFCRSPLKPREEVMACPVCGVRHHSDCWRENGNRCTVYGCRGRLRERVRQEPRREAATFRNRREADGLSPMGRTADFFIIVILCALFCIWVLAVPGCPHAEQQVSKPKVIAWHTVQKYELVAMNVNGLSSDRDCFVLYGADSWVRYVVKIGGMQETKRHWHGTVRIIETSGEGAYMVHQRNDRGAERFVFHIPPGSAIHELNGAD